MIFLPDWFMVMVNSSGKACNQFIKQLEENMKLSTLQWLLLGILGLGVVAVFGTCAGVSYWLLSLDTSDRSLVQNAPQTVSTTPPRQVVFTLPTARPTSTPSPTSAAFTPTPHPSPTPTFTPTPQPTPIPAFSPITRQIGPIYDPLHEEEYSVKVTLNNVTWLPKDRYEEPKPGNIFVVAYLKITNLGPGTLKSIGPSDFLVLDANGSLRDYELIPSAMDTCFLERVDLLAGGSTEGCLSFEVPRQGRVELIYAPYKYENMAEGRYLSLPLRQG